LILRQKKKFNNNNGRSKKKVEDQSEAKVQTNTTAGACYGNQLAAEASARAWRFPERIAVAVDLRQHRRRQLLCGNKRERQIDGQTGLDLGFRTSTERGTNKSRSGFQDLDGRTRL
jgi:hypothetical protein